MKLIYLAGRYRGRNHWEIKQNIDTAMFYAGEIVKYYGHKGFYPIVPHANTAFMDGLMEDDYFLKGTMEQLRRCDGIYMLPGWESSIGATAEYEESKKLGIKDYTKELQV